MRGKRQGELGKERKKYLPLLMVVTSTTRGGARGGRGWGRGVRSVEGRHEVCSMGEFRGRKPLIIGRGIAQPMHKVVECGADEM